MLISCFKLILLTITTISFTNGNSYLIDFDCQKSLADLNDNHLGLTLNELNKLYDKCVESKGQTISDLFNESKRSPFSSEGIRFKRHFSPKEEDIRYKKSPFTKEGIRFLRSSNNDLDSEVWFKWNPFSRSWFKRNPFNEEGIRFKKNPFEKEGIRFKKSVFTDEGIRYKRFATNYHQLDDNEEIRDKKSKFRGEGIRFKKTPFNSEGIRYKKSPFNDEGIRFKKSGHAFANEGIRYKKSPFNDEGIRFKKSNDNSDDNNLNDEFVDSISASINDNKSLDNQAISKKSPFNGEGIRY
ncbi:uncharacterized protein LOC128963533 [Oppia nitens]|uniref:uncharacterized protein LOC128963533 n=1 Tax=Oppia nitens TaxID=1686743 RepID=UPI0023DBE37C|nr:uncharacterized protein LOC128963533 [Oppia nitens]